MGLLLPSGYYCIWLHLTQVYECWGSNILEDKNTHWHWGKMWGKAPHTKRHRKAHHKQNTLEKPIINILDKPITIFWWHNSEHWKRVAHSSKAAGTYDNPTAAQRPECTMACPSFSRVCWYVCLTIQHIVSFNFTIESSTGQVRTLHFHFAGFKPDVFVWKLPTVCFCCYLLDCTNNCFPVISYFKS